MNTDLVIMKISVGSRPASANSCSTEDSSTASSSLLTTKGKVESHQVTRPLKVEKPASASTVVLLSPF